MPYKDINKQRKAQRDYRNKHKEKYKIYLKSRRDLTRILFKSILDPLTCCVCSENRNSTFDFHHLVPSEKDRTIADAKKKDWFGKKLVNEICKCAILCANCHRAFHAKELTKEDILKIKPIDRSYVETVFNRIKQDFRVDRTGNKC